MDDLMGEYLDALEPFLRDPEMREGQAYFNALGRSFGHLTADVVGTERDCFTVDRNLPAFLGWLEKALKREAVRRRWVRDGEMTDVFWAAVDAVNWRGHDVPGALRALAGGEQGAHDRFVNAVAHQHSRAVYAVLAPALPYLMAVTTQVPRARDLGVKVLLDVLSRVEWDEEPRDGAPHPDAVLRGLSGYWGYINPMWSPEARELVWMMWNGPNAPLRVRPVLHCT
ncbi:hypothetical protein AB0A74_05955 [Saccharothrix sp. NPDC042600]|uniref:hypothetical protein n=1 Tax=Saccharothrix TaxID=2071 RepID=UPI0033F60D92